MDLTIDEICEKYDLQLKHKFQLGNVCKSVFRVQDANGNALVVKIGGNHDGIAEIQKNMTGYNKLISMGLDSFIPRIHTCEINAEFALLIMEDCGQDVLTQIKKSQKPSALFDQVLERIEPIYRLSKRPGNDGRTMILDVLKNIKELYNDHLRKKFDPIGHLQENINSLAHVFDELSFPFCCFSNWDFTPDDVYLTASGIKYSDPHEQVTGIPIIDLACFAGVAVAHGLPGSDSAYLRIEAFAKHRVARILEIDENTAQKLFLLGRILQCFLSARFRSDDFPEQSKKLFAEATIHLEKLTG